MRPGGVGLEFDCFVQMLGCFGVLCLFEPALPRACIAPGRGCGSAATTGVERGNRRDPALTDRECAASMTLLAIAILSLGSVPATAVAATDDFCSPTYPSDASFCISDELNSADDLPPSPLKRRSNYRAAPPSCRAWPSNSGPDCGPLPGRQLSRRVQALGREYRDTCRRARIRAGSSRIRAGADRCGNTRAGLAPLPPDFAMRNSDCPCICEGTGIAGDFKQSGSDVHEPHFGVATRIVAGLDG